MRGTRGLRGAARDIRGEEEAARQGGGGRRVAARAGHAPLPTGARRKATEGAAVVGWAGHLGRQVSPGEVPLSHLSIVFCFLFSAIVLALLKMPEHFQKF